MADRPRADARRNYTHILTVAEEEIAAHGPDASMEQIARIAGVGSATVRRHFPTRRALLEAVSRKRVDALAARARDLTGRGDGRSALLEWLSDVVAYCVSARGLAAALVYDADPVHENACSARLEEAGDLLLQGAVRDGAIPADVTITVLITLIVGIVLATEHHPDPAAAADRLFGLAVAGLSPQSPARLQEVSGGSRS